MQYDLSKVKEHNKRVHLDIERDIQKIGNGILSFTIKVNDGDVVDYAPVEYVNRNKYLKLKSIELTELSVSYYNGK